CRAGVPCRRPRREGRAGLAPPRTSSCLAPPPPWNLSSRPPRPPPNSSLLRHDLHQRGRRHALLLRRFRHLDGNQLRERLVVAPAPPFAFQPDRDRVALDADRHAAAPGLAR